MMLKMAKRMLTETDKRLLMKFVYNFGWKGMRAVQRFQKRLKRGEYFPAFLFLSVTSACNLSCRGCWVASDTSSRQLSPDEIDRVISDSKKKGVYFFGILGGEPLLHRGLMDVLARHGDCYFLLFTNGMLITPETASRMRRMGNISPLISIEGLEQESDRRRGGNNVFHKSLEGLQNCRDQRLITGVATSVCKGNIDDLASEVFVSRMADLGVHYLWYYIYRPVGPQPAPELTLSREEILDLRRFIVNIRLKAPLMVVDSYWDHMGRALCPAAVGMANHVGPGGDVEPCPPIQFACDNVKNNGDLSALFNESEFLKSFRDEISRRTRGCILMDEPRYLEALMKKTGAKDTSGRGTAYEELKAMSICPSHHVEGEEIPEKSWPYRFAKKYWFFGFGAYG